MSFRVAAGCLASFRLPWRKSSIEHDPKKEKSHCEESQQKENTNKVMPFGFVFLREKIIEGMDYCFSEDLENVHD